MTGTSCMILAYAMGLGLFLGYGAVTWLTARSLDRTRRASAEITTDASDSDQGEEL